MGILAKSNPHWVEMAVSLGASTAGIGHLNWHTFIANNLIPVTLGNIIGGGVFVVTVYWLSYLSRVRYGSAESLFKSAAGKRMV